MSVYSGQQQLHTKYCPQSQSRQLSRRHMVIGEWETKFRALYFVGGAWLSCNCTLPPCSGQVNTAWVWLLVNIPKEQWRFFWIPEHAISLWESSGVCGQDSQWSFNQSTASSPLLLLEWPCSLSPSFDNSTSLNFSIAALGFLPHLLPSAHPHFLSSLFWLCVVLLGNVAEE